MTLLILATFTGPIVGAVIAARLIKALQDAARAKASKNEHAPHTGADLYHHGVHMDETQFREMYAAVMAELDLLPKPPVPRTDDDWQRQYNIVNHLGFLTGVFPRTFPVLDADPAWRWYAQNNWYANRSRIPAPRHSWRVRRGQGVVPPGPVPEGE